ncbi:sensor histidine kinase [Plectonema cf. radiosum LEGE 06105]|uniref:Circadian input-output histidine kinase CikA n=1 Tax=Plectonema cf. radiosum LEGE 06105 TaxID=945769 RepID=A0A8J7K4C4_9CYAN|nr:ATP-binding protein [Plectonema radiosum]MBE9216886.1 sensor histidine kinase [Plectonema cf. radiosum LEGE 06105]
MVNFRQSSFRRILVSKILLLSVPILLIGEFVVYQKARSSLIESARRNLTESAIIKGENILDTIDMLGSNLLIASQTTVLQSGQPQFVEKFVTQLAQQLPRQIKCIQLTNPDNGNIIAGNCDQQLTNLNNFSFDQKKVQIEPILPKKLNANIKEQSLKLHLNLSSPVYDTQGKLRYTLSMQSQLLHEKIKHNPGFLTASTVVIAENGTILAHPIFQRVGTNITEHVDAKKLQNIVKNAISGRKDSVDLFFEKEGSLLLAGYTAINSPVDHGEQKWVILAVTSLDNALYGLKEIKLIFFVLTIGLIGATLLASLYVARYLARPVEQLRDYALNLHSQHTCSSVPHNFNIREFNQLAQALDQMVERLKAWAQELEIAWKEAKTANQSKSYFLATTSHELRNPLNVIINSIRLVRDDLCDDREEEKEFLKRADETAIHLLGIINDLLDISRIEAGKLSVVIKPIDLRKAIEDVITQQSVNIKQKGLQLNAPQLNEQIRVNADIAKFKQVLINVIGNATKFTETGSITITTEIQEQKNKFWVTVAVIDTGIGIDNEQQQKLFRPFVMVDASNTRQYNGTGLGLAISRNLIELMGGMITLESPGINQGTTVKISLPLIDSEYPFIADTKMNSGNKQISDNNKLSQATFQSNSN